MRADVSFVLDQKKRTESLYMAQRQIKSTKRKSIDTYPSEYYLRRKLAGKQLLASGIESGAASREDQKIFVLWLEFAISARGCTTSGFACVLGHHVRKARIIFRRVSCTKNHGANGYQV